MVRGPRNDEAATVEPRNRSPILIIRRTAVDQELATDRDTARGIALTEHAGDTAAILVVGGPSNHVPAIRQGTDRRIVLVASGMGVDRKFRSDRDARRVITLAVDPLTA